MVARPMASGMVSFGLVSIPVKVFSATQPQAGVTFNLLHKKCGGRLKQFYECPRDANERVERDDMVKGYEYSKDRYVIFTPDELKGLEEKATQAIEIVEFVPMDRIDPIYFDKPYYLGPDKGGGKAYRLLAETMKRTKRCALAKYAARGKGYLVMLRPVDGKLVMQQLLYSDEVRSFDDVPVDNVDIRDQELKLAQQLVEQISSDEFHPERYQDDVRTRIQDQIQRKVEGQDVSFAPPEEGKAQIIDLMEALKASLARKAEAGPAGQGGAAGSATTAPASDERRGPKRSERGTERAEHEAKPAAKSSKK